MRDSEEVGGFGLRLVGVVVVLAMAPTLAFAYIDPGNGAYMVQALFALVGAALFYLRHPIRSLNSAWHWALDRFRQPPSPRMEESELNHQTVRGDADDVAPAATSLRDHS